MSALRQKLWYLLPVVVILSCVAAYRLGTRPLADSPPMTDAPPTPSQEYDIGGLVVTAASLDMGTVWEDSKFAWELPVSNRTNNPVKIYDFIVSCGCAVVEPRSLTVPAGGTETVTVKLGLTRRSYAEVGKAERPAAVEIIPSLGKGVRPRGRGWELRGVVRSRITTDVLALHFGDTPVHGQAEVTRTVLVTAHVPVQRLAAFVDAEVATVRVNPRSDGVFEVAVAPRPLLAPGPFKTHLALELITPEGRRLPGITLPVEGTMQSEIRPLPACVVFGPRPVGETAESFVTLQVPTGVDVAVEQAETESPNVRVEAASVEGLPPGQTFRVTQCVTKEGYQSSHFRLVLRKPGKEPAKIAVEVSYTGLATPEPTSAGEKGKHP